MQLKKGRCKTNVGKQFEDDVQKLLESSGFSFTREGSKRTYGISHSGKGKFDFLLENAAIECKSIDRDTNLRMPWLGTKNTALKAHQLKALREYRSKGFIAGLLIQIRSKDKLYWLNIDKLSNIIIDLGMVKALTDGILSQYAKELPTLADFVTILVTKDGIISKV